MTTHDKELRERLCREAREDDEAATPGPWEVGERVAESAATLRAHPCIRGREPLDPIDVIIPFGRAYSDARAIARTRNNLRAIADQLEAVGREIERMRHANASLVPGAMVTATEIECLRVERDAARAERDLMLPVVDAAGRLSIERNQPAVYGVIAAVDAYRTRKAGG